MSAALPIIRNAQGERLDVTFLPAAATPHLTGAPDAIVVLAHGVTAHKDRPWRVARADA